MATKEDYTGGMEEMDFSMVDNGFGLTLPTSRPATYSFLSEPELDTDAIEAALAEHDFRAHDWLHDQKEDGTFYCYFRVYTDHAKDVQVKVWNDTARIYRCLRRAARRARPRGRAEGRRVRYRRLPRSVGADQRRRVLGPRDDS